MAFMPKQVQELALLSLAGVQRAMQIVWSGMSCLQTLQEINSCIPQCEIVLEIARLAAATH